MSKLCKKDLEFFTLDTMSLVIEQPQFRHQHGLFNFVHFFILLYRPAAFFLSQSLRFLKMGLFQKIGQNNGRHFFCLNLQNGLNEIINYVMFIQFLLHIYIKR